MRYYTFVQFGKKHYVTSLLIVTTAFFFHTSAVIYPLNFLIMRLISIDKKATVVLFILIFISFSFFVTRIIEYLFTHIVFLTKYAALYKLTTLKESEIRTGLGMLSTRIMFALLLFFVPNIVSKQSSNAFIGFLILVMSSFLGSAYIILARITAGCAFLWFPVLHLINKDPWKYKCIFVLLLLIYGFLGFVIPVMNGSNEILPYKIIFSH